MDLLGFANGARFAGVVFKVKVLCTPYRNGLQMENLRQRFRPFSCVKPKREDFSEGLR